MGHAVGVHRFENGERLGPGDSVSGTLAAADEPDGAPRVHLVFTEDRTMNPCLRPVEVMRDERGWPVSPLPPLKAPAGVRATHGGRSGGADHWVSTLGLVTDQAPRELAVLYAEQLRGAGWDVDEPTEGRSGPVAARVAYEDPMGSRWYGALVVVSPPLGQDRHLMISVYRVGAGEEGAESWAIPNRGLRPPQPVPPHDVGHRPMGEALDEGSSHGDG